MIRPLLLILAAGPLAAQPPDWAAQARPVLAELYSLNHDRAEQLSLDLIHQHPGEPLGYALLARTLWARILNNEQALNAERFFSVPAPWRSSPLARKVPPDLRTRFLDSSRKAIDLARARLQSSPDHRPSLLILGFTYVNLAGFEWAVEGRLWQAFRSGEHAVDAPPAPPLSRALLGRSPPRQRRRPLPRQHPPLARTLARYPVRLRRRPRARQARNRDRRPHRLPPR